MTVFEQLEAAWALVQIRNSWPFCHLFATQTTEGQESGQRAISERSSSATLQLMPSAPPSPKSLTLSQSVLVQEENAEYRVSEAFIQYHNYQWEGKQETVVTELSQKFSRDLSWPSIFESRKSLIEDQLKLPVMLLTQLETNGPCPGFAVPLKLYDERKELLRGNVVLCELLGMEQIHVRQTKNRRSFSCLTCPYNIRHRNVRTAPVYGVDGLKGKGRNERIFLGRQGYFGVCFGCSRIREILCAVQKKRISEKQAKNK